MLPSAPSLPFGGPKSAVDNEEFLPGTKLAAEEGLYAKNSPNDSDTTIAERNRACGQKYFRKRMWGTMNQFRAVLLDRDCWMQHMMLSPETGMDPPGVKLRAAQGLDAADYLFPGYWVWARMISNLAAIGYDSNNMHLAAYDWRLSFPDLEKRDAYFSKLKSNIELTYESSGGRDDGAAVIITHSMGSLVFQYFLNWVESSKGGNGGKGWAEKYLHGWVNIGGPMLGVPKSVSSVISGETRDTAHLNAFGAYILEHFFSRQERADLFRSWGGLSSMFLYGGDELWGSANEPAPDEPRAPREPLMSPPEHMTPKSTHPESTTVLNSPPSASPPLDKNTTVEQPLANPSFAHLISITKAEHPAGAPEEKSSYANVTTGDMMEFLGRVVGKKRREMWDASYDFGLAKSKKDLKRAKEVPTMWSNALLAPLPKFKRGFKIICEYGVGLRTERKYFYTPDAVADANASGKNATKGSSIFALDLTVQDPDRNVENGVQMTNGDATVPLLSLGYMCAKGWKLKRYNPSGAEVVIREHQDKRLGGPIVPSLRGGPGSADHVDIMGNYALTEDILRIVAGADDNIEDRIYSNIQEIADRVKLPDGLD
ncbi:hypothetical protein HK097_006170 [Rhizophlyctis rosea]|uniref:Phospholipid:diacylglycerol acyltransferase n=1 Tax=Rhizophlyctis rosea TaxID=64517 RepID=A0AAD5SKP5_9FUNG|nr:hypothetical protein HK097_006170 [Rhizophlyctis rosea]